MRVPVCLYLVGDEDCGVSLYCRNLDDGGRPLVYLSYPDDRSYEDVPEVEQVSTLADLMSSIVRHAH